MEQLHEFFTDTIRMGKKGQITIPKIIRDEDELNENDVLIVTHMSGGDIVLRKKKVQKPEDRMLKIIRSIPPFDWRQAWKEVEEERKMEHR